MSRRLDLGNAQRLAAPLTMNASNTSFSFFKLRGKAGIDKLKSWRKVGPTRHHFYIENFCFGVSSLAVLLLFIPSSTLNKSPENSASSAPEPVPTQVFPDDPLAEAPKAAASSEEPVSLENTPSASTQISASVHKAEAPPPRSRPIFPKEISSALRQDPPPMAVAAAPPPHPGSVFLPKAPSSSSAPYRPKAFSSPSEGPFVEVSSASPKESVSPEDALSASKRQDRPWIDTRFASLMFWLMVPLSLIGIMVAVIGFYKFIKPTLLKNRLSINVASVGAFQPAVNSTRPQLFISYSRKDLLQVKPVIEEIERLGVSPWIDWQNIRGGMGWAGELVKAIRDCNGTVVMCSSAAFRSDDVLRELYIASHFGKPIGPIFLEDATPPDEFLFFLLRPQQMRLFEVSANQRRQKLENYLASVIAGNTCSLPHPIMVSPA